MSYLWSSLFSLIQLIKLKQKTSQIKSKLLKSIIHNNRSNKLLKKAHFQFQSVIQLFKSLIFLNKKQLVSMLLLSLVTLILRLFYANINTFLVQKFEGQRSVMNLVNCIIYLIVYKIIKAALEQWSSYQQLSYGFMGYSALYYHFLKDKNEITGEVLNIIEDDMQKLVNLPYCIINFPFVSIQIIVLTILLTISMDSQFFLIISFSLFLYVVNCIVGYLIFYMNQKIMKLKDYRLSLNLNEIGNAEKIRQARKNQVAMIKIYLLVNVIIKWFLDFSFVLFYGFIFLWNDDSIQQDNQLYQSLMLLGMLKTSFSSLSTQSYHIAVVLNSLKRIIFCKNKSQVQKSTIGCYEDFLKKNSENILVNSPQRQSTQSTVSSQSSTISSLRSSNYPLTEQQGPLIKQMKVQSSVCIKKKIKKYSQRGEIKIFQILKYIKQYTNAFLLILLVILALGTFYIKFENLKISNAIIHREMTVFQYVVFFTPIFLYTLFYFVLILIFVQISQNLFKDLNSQEIQGQDLNIISGDIDTVDKSVPLVFYGFVITTFGLLASLVLTVSLIQDWFLSILTTIFLAGIIWLCIFLNRYFMKSRREIKRLECKNKSLILQRYAEQIQNQNEQNSFVKVEKNWRRINMLKKIGILIENSYIFILNVLVLLIQIICFVVCYTAQIDSKTTKLILVFILQLDLSLTGLLLNSITLEMGLVNFERCLNFVKRRLNQQQNNQENHQTNI